MAAPQNQIHKFTPADLITALQAEGLTVILEDGWEDRTRPYAFHPEGLMLHHTGHDKTPVKTIRDGWGTPPGPNLPGPLAQFYPVRGADRPTVHLIAWGSANHPGSGVEPVLERTRSDLPPVGWVSEPDDDPKFYGNRWYWGVEAPGTSGSEWDEHQLEAIVGIGVALCKLHGWPATRVVAHGEWTSRKRGDPDYMWRRQWVGGIRVEISRRLGLSPAPSWPELLRLGSRHPTVRWLRGYLYALGFLESGRRHKSWRFDAVLDAAVRAFQLAVGLVVDGIFGPKTRAALYAAIGLTEG